MGNHIILTFEVILVLLCACHSKESPTQLDHRVIIIDIKKGHRGMITNSLKNLSKCSPQIIGLDIFLASDQASRYDSALVDGIEESGKVVILDALEDPVNLQPDVAGAAHKIAYSTRYEEAGKSYCPLAVKCDGKLCKSMGYVLATEFNSDVLVNFVLAGGNETWPLMYDDIYKEGSTTIIVGKGLSLHGKTVWHS
jgi:hypothetical protein